MAQRLVALRHGGPQIETMIHTDPRAHAAADIRAPSLLLASLEMARAAVESSMLAFSGHLLASAPRGDGHPVLVLPGFATDDGATLVLRAFLRQLGYDIHAWELGRNYDHRTVGQNGEHLARRIDAIRAATGKRISLIGWSLGGVIARETARRDPQAVRQVITLGSPFSGNPRATNLNSLYERMTGNVVATPAMVERFTTGHHPLEVPATAIYSKSDGITAWQNCILAQGEQAENVPVYASHFGMVLNPTVFYAIADRLALAEGAWTPFDVSGWRSMFYPRHEC
ncbi:esterase/lipase family protein [Sphingomonas profundi]|uniref:esterase/lipase family protein n=1 Tax=Alterirhizorhabdus profundi TaxID=2681549 RepID=UPI0018D117AD|nr:alpha/beta fold hydrolase [Sphingomonas profundi]